MAEAVPDRENLASLVTDFKKNGVEIAVVVRRGLRHTAYSYEAIAGLAERFAAFLAERSICKGDRVLLWAPNGPEWIAAFFGCVLRGVLPVPLDDAGSTEFAQRVYSDVSPKLSIVSLEHASALPPAAQFVTIDKFEASLPSTGLLEPVEIWGSDSMQIIFTSGTTGEPKGIVHTHANVLASLRPIEREIAKYRKYERIFHPLRFLHLLPLSHVFGQFMGLWIPAIISAEVHFEDRVVASDLVRYIRKNRISLTATVPRVLDLLREHIRQRYPDIDNRRRVATGSGPLKRWWLFRDIHRLFGLKFWALICGGAALNPELEEFWNSLGLAVIQGYGMTETTALVSLNHPFRSTPGTLGQVLPGREVKLSAEGEVLVRGETLSQKTWTAGRLETTESEWLATGDLAELDEAGNLRFRGRKKDVIVTSAGLNIHPDDLEAALTAQSEIKAAVVIESQGQHGPEPLAVLVLRDGDPVTAVSRANEQLAEYQRMHRWIVWPEPDLPRTSTGKIIRREVARLASGQGSATSGRGSLAALLQHLGRSQSGELPDAEPLNLDSLARVELQAAIEEQFGVTIDESAMQSITTAGDLRAILGPHPDGNADPGAIPAAPHDPIPQRDPHLYPLWPLNSFVTALRSIFLEVVMRGFVYFLARPKVERDSTTLPAGPLLIYANHVTAVDVPLILYSLPGYIRRSTAVAMSGEILLAWRRRTYYRYTLLNWLSPFEYRLVTALFNVFPLPQTTGFRRSFAHAAFLMDRRYNVIVFPEGLRASDEKIQPFRSGSGLLWSELRCSALPVYLAGLGELKRTDERWFRSSKLAVNIGKPIAWRPELTPAEAAALLEKELRNLEESQGGGRTSATPSQPIIEP